MDIGAYSFQEFKAMAAAFHGYPAPGLLVGGYMVELAKRSLPEGTIFDALVETPKCLPDAVQLLTLCSYGNGWMRVLNLGRYALSLYDKYTGEGVRVALDGGRLADWPHLHAWLYKTRPKKEQDTQALMAEIEAAGDAVCSVLPVRVPESRRKKPHMGRIADCPVCREPFPLRDGAICRGCQGEMVRELGVCHPAGAGALSGGPALRAVPVAEAVGQRLLHDMTEVIPGQYKDAAFQAGQTVGLEDVCRLQRMGRRHVYLERDAAATPEFVHENDCALAFAASLAGENVAATEAPREGKITLRAAVSGVLTVDVEALERFNTVPNVACATRQHGTLVEAGKPVAGCRAIPLHLSRENYSLAMAAIGEEPVLAVHPLRACRAGVLVTGTEVFQGLVQDRFAPLMVHKLSALGGEVVASRIVPDDRAAIAAAVQELLAEGIDLLVTTAGLSVDPDDVTRHGLMDAGLEDALYGVPAIPGNMTLVGRIGPARSVQVLGVPACALHAKTTGVDLLLPRLLAGLDVTRRDLARMGEGGFCLQCKSCTYPKCPFGK